MDKMFNIIYEQFLEFLDISTKAWLFLRGMVEYFKTIDSLTNLPSRLKISPFD